jgi:hypothetical protein
LYTAGIAIIVLLIIVGLGAIAGAQVPVAETPDDVHAGPPAGRTVADAQALFYNGRYDSAAALLLTLIPSDPGNLALYELRTSALLFQIKRAIGETNDRERALRQCPACRDWMSEFARDTAEGVKHARAVLKQNPHDDSAQFFLGKLDLNHVWLQLGILGRRTGWNEYWEARRSLDAVLERSPSHLRARLARAWIDYIVDTRMAWGTRWILGGGNKKKALIVMREAADAGGDFYTSAEARFALWDVQIRERNYDGAVATARRLSTDFPDNPELARFVATHGHRVRP